MKKYLPQFYKIQYILKVSFQETLSKISQILIYTCLLNILYWRCILKRYLLQFPKIWIYTKCVFSRDTFQNFTNFNLYYMTLKFDFILKMSLEETPSKIPIFIYLYWRYLLKRHLPQFHKIQYILKVSLEEIPSTISQNLIDIDFILKVSLVFLYNSKENGFIPKVNVSLQETPFTIFIHSEKFWIYTKGISWRDTFEKINFISYLV